MGDLAGDGFFLFLLIFSLLSNFCKNFASGSELPLPLLAVPRVVLRKGVVAVA